jgi:AhpD family alkylhydroperoxidase
MTDVSAKELIKASKIGTGKLVAKNKKIGPAVGGLVAAVLQDDNLTVKVKELIAVGIAVHAGCEMCMAHHVENSLKAGATEEELAEACGVAILMGGGLAVMHSGMAMKMAAELKE